MKTRFFLPLALAAAIFTAQPVFAQGINDLFEQGEQFLQQGNNNQAEHIFRRAVSAFPNDAQAYYNLGLVLRRQGKLDEAINNYRTAIRLDPNFALAYNNLGFALSSQGNIEEAIANYRTAIRLDPNLAAAYYNLGLALSEQKNIPEAIANYRIAIRLNPNNASAYNNLGAELADQGNLTEAIANYRNAIRLDPNNTNYQTNLREAEQRLAAGGNGSPATTGTNILQESGTLGSNSQVLASDGSLFNTHTFNGRAGQVVEINLVSSEFDTYLALLNPSGQLLDQNDDVREGNTNSFLRVTLPSNGSYTVVVNGLEKTSRGRYNLSVTAP